MFCGHHASKHQQRLLNDGWALSGIGVKQPPGSLVSHQRTRPERVARPAPAAEVAEDSSRPRAAGLEGWASASTTIRG